jgi:fatty acid desaturase
VLVSETAAPRSNSGADRRAVLEMIPAAWYHPSRVFFWTDFLLCASIGWASFAVLPQARRGWQVLFFLIAALALYRAALFTHELTHLSRSALPHFRLVWNALIGVPFLIPSFLYEGVHLDHHRRKTYGTRYDPEYAPFAHRTPLAIGLYLLGALLFPEAAIVRFSFLAPASWADARLRRLTLARFSALAINREYVRSGFPGGRWWLQELACSALCWTTFCAWLMGWVPGRVFLWWFMLGTTIRALTAHRYDNDGHELTQSEQLLDSSTFRAQSPSIVIRLFTALQVLWAPVGLRYHALHHWIPSLPYHNLGRAHRLLLDTLEDSSPYRATLRNGMWSTIVDLIRRSLRRRA